MALTEQRYHARLPPFDGTEAMHVIADVHRHLSWETPFWSDLNPSVASPLDRTRWSFDPKSGQVMASWHNRLWAERGAPELARLLGQCSHALGVILGRSTAEGFTEQVYESELTGDVTAVQWFQFYGPLIASRWPADMLRAGPFESVEMYSDGSVALTIRGNPHAPRGVHEAAKYLGLALRKENNWSLDID